MATRNILVRDLPKDISKKIDKIKKDKDIKTDSKAVTYLIENWEIMKKELEERREEVETFRDRSEELFGVLESLYESNKKLNNIFKKK